MNVQYIYYYYLHIRSIFGSVDFDSLNESLTMIFFAKTVLSKCQLLNLKTDLKKRGNI
jgi:hypothetical protein